jgi:two-component system cell cycle sensor histidine kinase/response regulator CckA
VASEEHYRTLFDAHPQPMWVHDAESLRILAVNDAAVSAFGVSRDELLCMTAHDVRPPAGTRLEQAAARPLLFEGRDARLVVFDDATERRRFEEQLLQGQKMEAVGQLAGGLAHDFNNLLGVIIGYNDLLLRALGRGHPAAHHAEQALRAADRAASLTRQLLAFSRRDAAHPVVLDLNAVVAGTARMLRRLIPEDVEIETRLDPALGRVTADPGQLEQVLMNLAINARDAMPRGGVLTLATENGPDGRDVILTVADTGQGIDQATLPRIFEPFFTTKAPGKGTGLGLATVLAIVRDSGASLGVETVVGRGTRFQVTFARVSGEARAAAHAPDASPGAQATETILLVEDAEDLREVLREVLTRAGYQVLATGNPTRALKIAALHRRPIHLLLADVVMRGLDGRRLEEKLKASRPEVRTVLMSGYPALPVEAPGFIAKPFSTEELLAKLREVLGGGR